MQVWVGAYVHVGKRMHVGLGRCICACGEAFGRRFRGSAQLRHLRRRLYLLGLRILAARILRHRRRRVLLRLRIS